MPHDLKFRILGNKKIESNQSIVPSLPFRNEDFAIALEKQTKAANKPSTEFLLYSITPIITIVVAVVVVLLLLIIIIELPHSKTILEITVEIEPQPAALDFKNLSQYSSRSK